MVDRIKGRKIQISSYKIDLVTVAGGGTGRKQDYNVKESIINVITAPEQKHKGFTHLEYMEISKKIMDCQEDYIILSEEEYQKIYRAFDNFSGYSRFDGELLERIKNAEQVELEEKKDGPKLVED